MLEKNKLVYIILLAALLISFPPALTACNKGQQDKINKAELSESDEDISKEGVEKNEEESVKEPESLMEKSEEETEKAPSHNDEKAGSEAGERGEKLLFRDVFLVEYETVINEDIRKKEYDDSLFRHEGNKLYYDSDEYDCLQGIDVSHHQGKIDWNKVKDQGYDFTIVRIGYRGYGKEGSLNADREYLNNLNGAREAGLKTGVYFFAQAINEEEALEEADFVLMLLKDLEIDLPVVYDPESILDDIARTDNISGEQFTKNARVFCDRIKEAGYEPMIYSNMLWEAFELDLTKLSDIEIWYADYEALPQTPYHFKYWQYSNEGRVEGIRGDVDLDIMLKEK